METGPRDDILRKILEDLADKDYAREKALAHCCVVIRTSANAIRTAHRGEFEEARRMLDTARATHMDSGTALASHPDIYHTGFVHDRKRSTPRLKPCGI